MLQHVFRALRSGGRVVITDREPGADSSDRHEVAMVQTAADLEAAGFRIVRKDPALLTDPEGEVWWLLSATKP
jgi:predicted methyltransferase